MVDFDEWLLCMEESGALNDTEGLCAVCDEDAPVEVPEAEASPQLLPEPSSPGPSMQTPPQPTQVPFQHWRPRYHNWLTKIMEVLGPVIEARGSQVHAAVCASHCSGSMAEGKCLELAKIKAIWQQVCDKNPSSYQFAKDNGINMVHFFDDMVQLCTDHKGWCVTHNQICALERRKRELHAYGAGVSCLPFSISNKDRLKKGTLHHPDHNLFISFVKFLKDFEPLTAWLENVFGFLLRESKKNPEAPITRFLKLCKEELGDLYHIQVYYLDSRTYLEYTRRRVWIHFMHTAAGGELAHRRMSMMLKACISYRLSQPPTTTSDIMLPDDDDRVLEAKHSKAHMAPHKSEIMGIC